MEISAKARQPAKVNQKLDYPAVGKEINQKSGIDLMQNCDLPPPLKVFTGFDKAVELRSMSNRMVYNIMGREDDKEDGGYGGGGEDEKLEIMKALRLSQTRAREAERKATGLAEEKQRISNAYMKDSLQMYAYRQWVRLLEVQVWVLKSEMANIEKSCSDKAEGGDNGDEMSLIVALAICLGIATVGFAFGCRYLF